MDNELKIESGIPITSGSLRSRTIKTLLKMKDGDSVKISVNASYDLCVWYQVSRDFLIKIATKKLEAGVYRVWRVSGDMAEQREQKGGDR